MRSNDNNYWWRDLKIDFDKTDTRERLLIAAYQEMHINGFQSSSLSHILERAGMTKGALYHHFKNKSELAHAVIDEIISGQVLQGFMKPMEQFDNPIDGLSALIMSGGESFTLMDIQLGCPLNNLSQEMALIDEVFRQKLNLIYERWIEFMEQRFIQGQKDGYVKEDINCHQMAVLIVATLEGCISAAKVSQNLESLQVCGAGLIQHLNYIRTETGIS